MYIDIDSSTINLDMNGMVTLQDGSGAQVVCRSGSLWVTQEGELKDWVIEPDNVLTIHRSGRTIITALEAASLTLIGREQPGQGRVHRALT